MHPSQRDELNKRIAYARACKSKGTPKRDTFAQLKRLYAMQDVMYATATDTHCITDEKGNVILGGIADKVSAVRAWKELELLRRLILGKPGSITAAEPKNKPGCGKLPVHKLDEAIDIEKAA